MDELRSLLAWNAKVTDPFFLGLVGVFMIALTVLILERPKLYLPLLIITAPLPKLFTISSYTNGADMQSAPGFSVVDLVLAAGVIALLLRRRRKLVMPEALEFMRSVKLWTGSIIFSIAVGVVIWSGTYRSINVVYAVRYLLTLFTFAVGAQYAFIGSDEASVRKLLYRLALAGNLTVLAGLAYYFEFGSSGGGARGINLMDDAGSAVYRSYLWFFDYGIDMGYFLAMMGVLNVILLSDKRLLGLRVLNAAGLLGCISGVLLLGERVNVLVIGVALLYFLWETSSSRHRSVRVSVVFQIGALIVIVGAFVATMTVVAPEYITKKFQESVGSSLVNQEYGLYVMKNAGVPDALGQTIINLPMGDFAARLSLNLAGLWYFFSHPEGVGFWGQLDAAGFWSHHEIVTIAIEQGVFGLVTLWLFVVKLKRLLWTGKELPGAYGQLGVLLRATSVGLFAAMVMANTVLLDLKYMMVYWTLVGVWAVIPRGPQNGQPGYSVTGNSQRVPVHA